VIEEITVRDESVLVTTYFDVGIGRICFTEPASECLVSMYSTYPMPWRLT
jgi:hypothetical protein